MIGKIKAGNISTMHTL